MDANNRLKWISEFIGLQYIPCPINFPFFFDSMPLGFKVLVKNKYNKKFANFLVHYLQI